MTVLMRGDRVPDGAPGRAEDCLSINPANIQVQNVRGSWKIVDGSTWVLDFSADRAEAQQTADIIRYHGMSRQCFIGRPGPSMTYWLATR